MPQEDFVIPHVRSNLASNAESDPSDTQQPVSARAVLEEIFQLLEEYAPTWYTETHHDRIVAALISSSADNQPHS